MKHKFRTHRSIKSITSLPVEEFDAVSSAFEEEWNKSEESCPALRTGLKQHRALGAGRPATLGSPKDKLLFILFWFKAYPTFDEVAVFFGMSQPPACIWPHRPPPALAKTLKQKLTLPARKPRNLTETLVSTSPLTFIVAGAERPVSRPKNGMRRKACHSVRKKRYAIKNILAVSDKRIVAVSWTRPVRRHDKKCIDIERRVFPRGSTILGDRGFADYTQPFSEVRTPKRRPNHERALEHHRPFTKQLVKRHLAVEHATSGLKRSRIYSDILRSRKPGMQDKVMLIGCVLHNFGVDSRMVARQPLKSGASPLS